MDEIPVAKREINTPVKTPSLPLKIGGIVISGMISFVIVWVFLAINNFTASPPQNNSSSVSSTTPQNQGENPPLASENIPPQANPPQEIEEIPQNILGHLAYEEAPAEELQSITTDGRIKLRKKAATKFLEMQQAARREGITLVPISGFRNVSEQEYLFFTIKEQRKQPASKRAEVSAPPGYSEHHTGYAVDIGDGNAPATNLNTNFEETPAYHWLKVNAPRYSFELSFPKDNLQGISYEPWHWRFVGDTHSLETFYQARQLKTHLKP